MTWPFFFVQGVLTGLALAAKTFPHRPQVFKKVDNGQALPQETAFFSFFSERADCRYSKASPSFLTPTVDPVLKLGNYKATTQMTHFSAPKSNVHAVFKR